MNGYLLIKRIVYRVLRVLFISGGSDCNPVPVYLVTDAKVKHVRRSVRIVNERFVEDDE